MNNEITTTENKPWEQLKGEKSRQFLAFCRYLELGNRRKFSNIASYTNVSPGCIHNWAQKWNWEERASAFDRHSIEMNKKEKREQYEKVKNIHSKSMNNMSLLIYKLIDLINKKTRSELNKMSDMELTDFYKALKLLTNILPSLSDIASANLSQSKPLWQEEETPLDFMTIYDKHPELVDDVNDLLGKIINAETNDAPLFNRV